MTIEFLKASFWKANSMNNILLTMKPLEAQRVNLKIYEMLKNMEM